MATECASSGQDSFQGFESLDGNFVFTPNQFFDLVIPNYSRPVVRLIAYVMYETLRWLDEDGHPVNQDIAISFSQLVKQAGISRGSIRKAIAEAVDAGLIKCKRKGVSKSQGSSGQVGEYSLRWDDSGHYAKSLARFQGFYLGQGNRTPIPHSFFTHVLPNETHAVSKVVGTVLRHTIGYQNQYGGGRRSEASLSFKRIQRYANIASSSTLAEAVNRAVRANYIQKVTQGQFVPGRLDSTATVYAINWHAQAELSNDGSKIEAEHQFKKRSRASVQKSKSKGFNNQSRVSPKNEANGQFKKRSPLKETLKTNSKEQQTTAAAFDQQFALLTEAGYDPTAAKALAECSTIENTQNQIAWLKHRAASKNPLGLLRKAIVDKWPEPTAAAVKRKSKLQIESERIDQKKQEDEESRSSAEKKLWIDRWTATDKETRNSCKTAAIENEGNPVVRRFLQKRPITATPPPPFVIELKKYLAVDS